MRERLKELDIRITELADYLHLSRPTLYKFIDMYEQGTTRGIDRGVLDLFKYIEDSPYIGKKNVVSYIINNLSPDVAIDESSLEKAVKTFEKSKSYSREKADFIQVLINSQIFDELIPYFNRCNKLLSSDDLSEEDIDYLGNFLIFRDRVENNYELLKKEKTRVKQILED